MAASQTPFRTEYSTLGEWIASEAIAFDLSSQPSFNLAVDRMISLQGDSLELLGFGEPYHADDDFVTMRNRLFQGLVESHGFSAIAVESSFPRGRVVNDYVLARGAVTSFDDVKDAGFSHGFGAHKATRELVEWMRAYNADESHAVKLQFYGFDSPTEMMWTDSPRQLLESVLDFLESIDSAIGQAYRDRIEPLIGDDAEWETQAAAMDATKSIGRSPAAMALRIATEDVCTELSIRRPELVARGGAERYAEAVHYATSALQLLFYHAAIASTDKPAGKRLIDCLGMRDTMMANNLAYISSRERGRGRVLAFAHNSHLKCGQAEWQLGPEMLIWWPAGAHLRAMFGDRYVVIGSGVGVSEANGIGVAETGTLEALFAAGKGAGAIVPTHRGQCIPAAAIESLPTRSGSTINSTYFPLTPKSIEEFDWLAVLN